MIDRRLQLALSAFLLALISAVQVTQASLEIYRGSRPQFLDVFTQVPTAANLRLFEKDLERASWAAQITRPPIQLAWVLLGNAGETAIVGRDGWLFYKPDLRYLLEPPEPDASCALTAIAHFQQQLASRGIHLLVVPVPGKPAIYPGMLRAGHDDIRSPTEDLLVRLRAAGIETVDLFSWLRASQIPSSYLARDTHWTPAAAHGAAQFVAQRIRDLHWAPPPSMTYAVRPVTLSRRGDLVRMLNAPSLESRHPPEPVTADQVLSPDGRPYRDDASSPVLILGDSFLRIYQGDEPGAAGFIAHLARELQTPLASIVNDGGASTLVRQELSRRPALLDSKTVVIWEFAERDIRFGAEGWQDVPLSRNR
jgi:hypothetical protein